MIYSKRTPEEDLFLRWYSYHYEHMEADRSVEPFLKITAPAQPWLKKARQALFLSQVTVANRLKISTAGYRNLEKSEELGTISLANLKKAAEALDCELIYSIRPKNKQNFSEGIWKKLKAAVDHQTLYHFCAKMYDFRFRKQQGWARASSAQAQIFQHQFKIHRDISRSPGVGDWPIN